MDLENLSKEDLVLLKERINEKLGVKTILELSIKDLMDDGYLINPETINDDLGTIASKYTDSLKGIDRETFRILADDEGIFSFDWLVGEMDGTELSEVALITDSLHGDLLVERVGCEGIAEGVKEIIGLLDNFEVDGSSFTRDEIKTYRGYYQRMLDIIE